MKTRALSLLERCLSSTQGARPGAGRPALASEGAASTSPGAGRGPSGPRASQDQRVRQTRPGGWRAPAQGLRRPTLAPASSCRGLTTARPARAARASSGVAPSWSAPRGHPFTGPGVPPLEVTTVPLSSLFGLTHPLWLQSHKNHEISSKKITPSFPC